MEFTMDEDKRLLVRNNLHKSVQALDDAKFNFAGQRYLTVLNRIYYSIFYSALALAYQHDFVTSKHSQLKGWFNRKIIHEEKLFDSKMMKIYRAAYERRQEADYEILEANQFDKETVELALNDAEYFCGCIKEHLKFFLD